MTTTAMVIGMLPLAIATDSGSEWKSGLAWAIIGGLISSMFLTLVLVPVIYMRAELWKEHIAVFFRKVFRKNKKKEDIPVPEELQPEEN